MSSQLDPEPPASYFSDYYLRMSVLTLKIIDTKLTLNINVCAIWYILGSFIKLKLKS